MGKENDESLGESFDLSGLTVAAGDIVPDKPITIVDGKIVETRDICDVEGCAREVHYHGIVIGTVRMDICIRCYFSFIVARGRSDIDDEMVGKIYEIFNDSEALLRYVSAIADATMSSREEILAIIDEEKKGGVSVENKVGTVDDSGEEAGGEEGGSSEGNSSTEAGSEPGRAEEGNPEPEKSVEQ